jgi:phage FluMu protein Com
MGRVKKMARCLDCETIYAVYGGSKGSKCPVCKSRNIDTPKENKIAEVVEVSECNSQGKGGGYKCLPSI